MKHDCRLLGEDSKESLKSKKGKRSSLMKCQRDLVVQKTTKLFNYLHTVNYKRITKGAHGLWTLERRVICVTM